MSAEKPFIQVQIVHLSTTYDNQLPDSNANFLKLKNLVVKRAKGQVASIAKVQIFNKNGKYNSVALDDSVNIWSDTDITGASKVKIFSGTITRIERKRSKVRGVVMDVEAKDKTIDLMNGKLFDSFSAGDVKTGGDGSSYTLNDYGQIVKYIMSFQGPDQANPGKITVTNVQNSGSNITSKKTYRYTPTHKVLLGYAQLNNFDIYVDVNNDLHFQPKNTSINSTVLTSDTNIESMEEVHDIEDEKNQIYVYAGKTTDGTAVVGIYRGTVTTGGKVKSAWKYNPNLAPTAAGGDASTRVANARLMAREWGRLEYEKIKNKHTYRITINQMITMSIGDVFQVTDAEFGLSATQLRLSEVEETFVPNERYKGALILDTNLT